MGPKSKKKRAGSEPPAVNDDVDDGVDDEVAADSPPPRFRTEAELQDALRGDLAGVPDLSVKDLVELEKLRIRNRELEQECLKAGKAKTEGKPALQSEQKRALEFREYDGAAEGRRNWENQVQARLASGVVGLLSYTKACLMSACSVGRRIRWSRTARQSHFLSALQDSLR